MTTSTARRKQNAAFYDQVNVVSEGEVNDLIRQVETSQVETFQAWVTSEAKRRKPSLT